MGKTSMNKNWWITSWNQNAGGGTMFKMTTCHHQRQKGSGKEDTCIGERIWDKWVVDTHWPYTHSSGYAICRITSGQAKYVAQRLRKPSWCTVISWCSFQKKMMSWWTYLRGRQPPLVQRQCVVDRFTRLTATLQFWMQQNLAWRKLSGIELILSVTESFIWHNVQWVVTWLTGFVGLWCPRAPISWLTAIERMVIANSFTRSLDASLRCIWIPPHHMMRKETT